MAEPTKELSLPDLPGVSLAGLPDRFQPRNLTELMSWSKLVYSSGLAPKDMNEAGIVLAVQMGAELNITPTQALAGIAVVNGRASIWGDLGKAIFLQRAKYEKFEDRDPAEAKAKGEGWCRITMKDGRVIERIFTRQMATEAKCYERAKGFGPWATFEGDMLQWRAVWRAMRHADPGVFKGLSSREEMQDVIDAEDIKVDGVPQPRRRSEGVPTPEEIDRFVKGAGKSAPASQPNQGGPAMPPKPPPDRSTLKEVMVENVQDKKGPSGKSYFIVTCIPPTGSKFDASTFSETLAKTARDLKGQTALIGTKVVHSDKDNKDYTNLTHIEAKPQEGEPPSEPGENG